MNMIVTLESKGRIIIVAMPQAPLLVADKFFMHTTKSYWNIVAVNRS
jgi:hypothetical protein